MKLNVINNAKDVAENHMCNGCGTCAYLNPESVTMVDTLADGRRPLLKDQDADHRQSMTACPGVSITQSRKIDEPGLLRELFNDWGPVLEVWEAHSSDPVIRHRGSSGGAITALALYAIEHGGYSGVLHTKARKDQPLLNTHAFSEDRQQLLDGAGSRYAPASPCEGLSEIENAQFPAVFIGKPCDVAGAEAAARLRPALAKNLGITIALFCAGTPSLQGSIELLKKMGVKNPNEVSSFRYRGHGWPGDMTATVLPTSSARPEPISYAKGWGETLQKHRAWRCNMCADHTGELADISVGDPWYDKPRDGEDGRSLIIVRTHHGARLVREAIASGYLVADRKDASALPAAQPHLLHARGAVFGRTLASRLSGVMAPSYPGMPVFRTFLSALSLKQKAQSIYGAFTRIKKKGLQSTRTVETMELPIPSPENPTPAGKGPNSNHDVRPMML